MDPKTSSKTIIKEEEEEDDEDEYILRIKRTGCFEQHEALQNCYFENGRDWRICRQAMKDFKDCFDNYQQSKNKSE